MQGVEVEDQNLKEETVMNSNNKGVVQVLSWTLPRLLALLFLIVLLVWIMQAEGGFGWNEATVFGWHALLMGLFIVFFTQEAILSFAAPLFSGPFSRRNNECMRPKYIHVFFHSFGIICAMLGIVSIVYYKSMSPQPIVFPFYSVYSPHSWLGIAVLCLWGVQFAIGTYIYGFGEPNPEQKAILGHIHGYLGKAIYVSGLATCALGLQDMQSSDLASSTPPMSGDMGDDTMAMGVSSGNMSGYFPNSPEAQYSSACTLLLLFTGMATFGTLALNKFVRALMKS